MIYIVPFLSAFVLSFLLLFLLIRLSHRYQLIDRPRADRWHRAPKPKLGGVGLFVATMVSFVFAYWLDPLRGENFPYTLFVGMILIFLAGILDDFYALSPVGKLITQVVAASIAIFFGYTTNFFTPRLGESVLAHVLNSGASLIWLIAITNAMNLIDNMDGLAGGISLIICLFMGYFFWDSGETLMVLFCSGLAGALLGFLFLNFPPAKIFMGDSGSQFLGFSLALLAIARQPQASNVFAIIGVPALLFTLPLADAFFVAITRWLRGRSPFMGGKDHTSHRLIAFGLSERQALWVLYSIALFGGIAAIIVESLNYTLSLLLLPLMIVFLLIFTTYLAGVKITETEGVNQQGKLQTILVRVFLGRNLLDVLIDGILISFGFYLAVIFGRPISLINPIEIYIRTLPLAVISGYLAFFFFKVYGDLWRHLSVETIYRYLQAALSAAFFLWFFRFFFSQLQFLTSAAIMIFGATLFVGLMVTRFSFRALDSMAWRSRTENTERVLLYAPTESLDYLIPFLYAKNQGQVNLIGILTDQEIQVGKRIFDIRVLGTVDQLIEIVRDHQAQGIYVDDSMLRNFEFNEILSTLVGQKRCWVKVIKLEVLDYSFALREISL